MVQSQSAELVSFDSVWSDFLQQKVNSFIKWDLVRFFHDNPHTADTIEHIAHYIGRDSRTVIHELDGLVKTGILQSETINGVAIYKLVDHDETRHFIRDFVAACHNRDFRVKAIRCVIQGMENPPAQV